jgi:NADH-quinone oxidoreductase subunit J
VISVLFALALFVELTIALVGTGLEALTTEGAPYRTPFGEPSEVGRMFLTDYLVAFEVASLLLLIAAVGAVILARRRSGLGDSREISVTELLGRDELTKGKGEAGKMIEAGGPRDI